MSEEKVEKEKVEDVDDDVVIIGNVIPKPIISQSHTSKRQKRHIEQRKSKSVDGTLVITQKLKVKKRKHRCKLNAGTGVIAEQNVLLNNSAKNVSNHKGSFEQEKSVQNSSQGCVRITPICLRKNCRNVRCKIESNIQKRKEKTRKKVKTYIGFPRDLKRLLSPVSLNSLSHDLSKCLETDFEISLDASSLDNGKESDLDTLIKRTRERDRNNELARTKYLSTPPHADKEVSNENTEDKETCIDPKPLYTSTPKYEEKNDTKNVSIANNNIEKSNIAPDTFFNEVQSVISPIKKSDNICTVIDKNNEQNVSNQNDSFTKQTNDISHTSSTNYGDNMSISDTDNVEQSKQSPITVLVTAHTPLSHTGFTTNLVTDTNSGQNLDRKIVCNCKKNDITKLQSLNNSPHSVERNQNKTSENIHTPLSNQNCNHQFKDFILLNNPNTSHPLNCVPLPINCVPISPEMYSNLGLIQVNSGSNLIQENETNMQMSAFNNNQNVESNSMPVFYNDLLFQNINQNQIPVSFDKNMQYSEYQKLLASNNSVQNQDHRNISFSLNDEITKKQYLDHSSFSPFSNKNSVQNVEKNDKPLSNNCRFSQNPNQNYILLYGEKVQSNKTESMCPSKIKSDQNIKKQGQSDKNFSFPQPQNQECVAQIPLSEDLSVHISSDYPHTFINIKNNEQNINDNVNSSCDDYSLSRQQDVLLSEKDIEYKKPEYLREDFYSWEDISAPPDNRHRHASLNEDPFLDENDKYKSKYEHEFPNIEHEKPSYRNNNFNRHFSQERSLFYDEIVEHRKFEYRQRKYSNTNYDQYDNDKPTQDHYNRETFEQFDEYLHVNNEKISYKRRRTSINSRQNTGDRRGKSQSKGNNNKRRSNWNPKRNYDDGYAKQKKPDYINADSSHMNHPRDIEDRNKSIHDRFTGTITRDYKEFLKEIRQKRFDYEETVMTNKRRKQNTDDREKSPSRNKKIRDRSERRSPFVDDLHIMENEESAYYTNTRKSYLSNNNLTKQPKKNHRLETKKKNNSNQESKRYSELRDKNKYNREKIDHTSFFEEVDFQYEKSDLTYKHTVYTKQKNPNYEHKRRMFNNKNQRNKPYNK